MKTYRFQDSVVQLGRLTQECVFQKASPTPPNPAGHLWIKMFTKFCDHCFESYGSEFEVGTTEEIL